MGTVEDFEDGTCKILSTGGRSIGVYNVRGRLYAVQNVCPHQLSPICDGELLGQSYNVRESEFGGTMLPSAPGKYEYGMEGRILRCGRHGWEFDIETGEALFTSDRRRLATFPVVVDNGMVGITLRPRGHDRPAKPKAAVESE